MRTQKILAIVKAEVEKAEENWPKITGSHEGASLIQEELEEYRKAIRKNQLGDNLNAMDELIQVAAMAVRTLKDYYYSYYD